MQREDPAVYPGTYATCVYNPDKALCRQQHDTRGLAHQAAGRRQTPPPSRYDQLQQTNARLRQDNRELRGQLEFAAAVLQRVTLQNQRLRQQAEAAANVTRLSDTQPRGRSLPPKTPRRSGSRSGPC
jgi:hypothetical protein